MPSSSAYVLSNLVTVVLLSAPEIEGMGVNASAEYILFRELRWVELSGIRLAQRPVMNFCHWCWVESCFKCMGRSLSGN